MFGNKIGNNHACHLNIFLTGHRDCSHRYLLNGRSGNGNHCTRAPGSTLIATRTLSKLLRSQTHATFHNGQETGLKLPKSSTNRLISSTHEFTTPDYRAAGNILMWSGWTARMIHRNRPPPTQTNFAYFERGTACQTIP